MNLDAGAEPWTVDAHHHLWRYDAGQFEWIDDSMAGLRRNFTAAELGVAMQAAGVSAAVAVQARQSLEETAFLLEQARAHAHIAGVVGWLPLAQPVQLAAALEAYASDPWLAGARHIVQAEAPGFLDDPAFNEGMRTLTRTGLAWDLLLRADQLEEATRFVDAHPRQPFVLDHLAKPRIAAGLLEPWRTQLRALAAREHVCCKLSGMVTEDDWAGWSAASLRPYLDAAVEAFGTGRLLAGSDWPVCLVASSYGSWWQTLRNYFAEFSAREQAAVFGGNAVRFYRLAQSAV